MGGTISFHPTARTRQEDEVLNFAKARNAAINTAGGTTNIRTLHAGLSLFKLADSPTDGLPSKDTDLSHPSYQRLMTKGDKGVVSGIDHLRSDPRMKLANELHFAKQVVNRSNQTLSTIFDQTSFKLTDRVRKNSTLKPDNYLFQFEQEKTDKSLIGVQSFDQIVKAVMGDYNLHPGASSETKRLMEKATIFLRIPAITFGISGIAPRGLPACFLKHLIAFRSPSTMLGESVSSDLFTKNMDTSDSVANIGSIPLPLQKVENLTQARP